MPTLTLTFENPIQDSVQVGDEIFFTPVTTVGGASVGGDIISIGPCASINAARLIMTVTYPTGGPTPGTSPYGSAISSYFILFSKHKNVNPSGLIGYYAEATMKNNELDKVSELFSVGADIFESSK